MRIGHISSYQMAKTASELIPFFKSYSPKTGVMRSSFEPNSAESKNLMGQVHHTVILRWNGWYIGCFDIQGGPGPGPKGIRAPGPNEIGPWAHMRSAPGPKWDWAPGRDRIWRRAQMRFFSGPKWGSAPCSAPGSHAVQPRAQMRLSPGPK